MRAAEHWNDFEVLDTSSGEKLERWGNVVLARPDPQIIWNTPKGDSWKKINAGISAPGAGAEAGRCAICPPAAGPSATGN